MLQIAICDDEKYYLGKIAQSIKEILHRKGIGSYEIDIYSSGTEFLESGKLYKYHVIFLDINMPQMNGMEAAKKIRESSPDVLLVFITAFIDYAIYGYQLEATRFLLKDMLDGMLPECMETIIKKLSLHAHSVEYSFNKKKIKIPVDTICYIESQKHKLYFHLFNRTPGKYSLYEKLDNIEKDFLPYHFLRIHKSFLVNTAYIKEIANYRVKLTDGRQLPVPKDKYQKTKERFYEIQGELL